ncbi:hypothetical protein JJD41_23815 [Oxynema sp. CENA135]|uniref:hypothetical protein n=1 Tax=Oxynema sp. CENA135 TaxID=984206 RepID=UPI00190C0621|nr:hypothetical protein [Oxynema sp. CENA135]MBK4732872.1 hypothetical protein [Oxynema sp. CENA135]
MPRKDRDRAFAARRISIGADPLKSLTLNIKPYSTIADRFHDFHAPSIVGTRPIARNDRRTEKRSKVGYFSLNWNPTPSAPFPLLPRKQTEIATGVQWRARNDCDLELYEGENYRAIARF